MMRTSFMRSKLDSIECKCNMKNAFHSYSRITAPQRSTRPTISSRFRLSPDFTPSLPPVRRSKDTSPSWRSAEQLTPSRLNPSSKTSLKPQERKRNHNPSANFRVPSLTPSGAITSIPDDSPALSFSSSNLSNGIQEMIKIQLGKTKIKPTVIQSLALERFLYPSKRQLSKMPTSSEIKIQDGSCLVEGTNQGSETLLAAETGSGKTMAYLLPLLNRLVKSEKQASKESSSSSTSSSTFNPLVQPRAIILAPTHELARQLAASAKGLCHIDKLRVLCLSSGGWLEALKEDVGVASSAGSLRDIGEPTTSSRPAVDIVVSTPARLLDVIKSNEERKVESQARAKLVENGRLEENRGSWKRQLVSLDRATAIVVDEADALFDRDFVGATRAVLHRMREAAERRLGLDFSPDSLKYSTEESENENNQSSINSNENFNNKNPSSSSLSLSSSSSLPPLYDLILATATIPTSLSRYLSSNHPNLISLLSPGLHRLPPNLKTSFVDPGSSKHAAVASQVKKVLDEDEARFESSLKKNQNKRAKILIFVNKTHGVELLSSYLTERGIQNVAITGSGDARSMRSNSHLSGFLSPKKVRSLRSTNSTEDSTSIEEESKSDLNQEIERESITSETKTTSSSSDSSTKNHHSPRVLITTSLLARGLDFVQDIHVFLPDASPSRGSRSSSYNPNLNLNPSSSSQSDSNFNFDSTDSFRKPSGGGLAAANSSLELLHRAGRAARAGRAGKVILFDSKSAGDRPLMNRTGKRVGRVRGRAEKMIQELTRRRK